MADRRKAIRANSPAPKGGAQKEKQKNNQITMRKMMLIGCLTLATSVVWGQNVWQTLAKITYTKQYDELMGFKVDVPVFSADVKALAGKEVTLKGYIIPVEGYKGHKEFIFSAFPYNMCFFCGGAGPETVMEVFAKEPIQYQAESITLKGRLKLNDKDINQLMYILENAVLVK
jgi:hypothetical protein